MGGRSEEQALQSDDERLLKRAHAAHRQEDARHERIPRDRVVADRQRLPDVAEDDLLVRERPDGVTIIAGAGSNDTAHAVALTAAACELGVDAVLSVTPYYNRPSRLGLKRHYEAAAAATDKPTILYNIPGRTATNMPPDLLAELAQAVRARRSLSAENVAMPAQPVAFTK